MPLKIDFVYLLKAIEENVNISVNYRTELKEILTYRSRFFDVNRDENYIIIDFPTSDHETFKPLVPHDEIFILFKFSGFRFLFESEILDRIEYQLNPENKITAFKVRLPEMLLDGNRRNFFRVTVPMEKPFQLYYFIFDPMQKKRAPVSLITDPDKSRFLEAVMIDISEGGIAIKSENQIALKQGTKVMLWFKLEEKDKEFIRIEGVIRNSRKYGDKEVALWGVEFVPKRDIYFKRALTRINKFVMCKQREFLAKFR